MTTRKKKATRKPVNKKTSEKRGPGRPRIYDESGENRIMTLSINPELRERIQIAVDRINAEKSPYMPKISRNAFIKSLLTYGLDNVDKMIKN